MEVKALVEKVPVPGSRGQNDSVHIHVGKLKAEGLEPGLRAVGERDYMGRKGCVLSFYFQYAGLPQSQPENWGIQKTTLRYDDISDQECWFSHWVLA